MRDILEREILPALGCTEPIAVAYAAATAYKEIEGNIHSVECYASGNIIKNVTSVIIPGTNGLCGMKAAVAAGIAAKTPELKMEVLSSLDDTKLTVLRKLLNEDKITVRPSKSDKGLYIEVKVITDHGYALVLIEDAHDNIVYIEKNSEVIYEVICKDKRVEEYSDGVCEDLSLEKILQYIENASLENLDVVKKSILLNKKICDEGLKNNYGLAMGKYLKDLNLSGEISNNGLQQIISTTVAGTDARMAGCSLPAMSNSGSGNQGIATTMPVVSYGEHINASEEKIIRAAALSNLVTISIKNKLGRLSSLCGVVLASAGASCGIIYLLDGNIEEMEKSINNVMGNIAGMFCDGAKAGCSLKVATGIFVAIISAHKALEGNSIKGTDGIVENSVEKTIDNYSRVSENIFKSLDYVLLDIMLQK
ncbi:serine dehydratase subunit alpha family protein [Clostridium formicaceticum]|uniref:UPF0597 protein BJL90_11960 n=1 Tax=Clostridium formicaceticum TaxID=1497 RepID=A0AAC9RIY8_9CLOT|nr:L-serine ammonia-lyase, iron-sulfur-dependent, subunit alpha [Clostridium formicaceticum]AOY76510.1 hypothetical protein BJL90_11960 [Clostridium formicaceticum]ARE86921.1 Serine dehydratase alpha chain [Clostridium formicaceticum]